MYRREAQFMRDNPDLFLAYAAGKRIERANKGQNNWHVVTEGIDFNSDKFDFRVKTDPRVLYTIERNNGEIIYKSNDTAATKAQLVALNDEGHNSLGIDRYRPYRLVKYIEEQP